MKKGTRIRLINDQRIRRLENQYPNAPQCRSTKRIKVGTEGVIVATRPLDSLVLVKFIGCSYQIVLFQEHVETM